MDYFSDFELANECLNYCMGKHVNCILNCSDDVTCTFECGEQFYKCSDFCPCRPECPTGCEGCSSSFCQCRNPETSQQYIECEEKF